ncbi:MAK10-like protein [Tanacetum coccineum]
MEAHTERIERFKKAIFKQREQIDDRMAEVFDLLKELTANRALEKVLVREEARHPITKHVNSISLIRMEVEMVVNKNVVEPNKSDVAKLIEVVDRKEETEGGTDDGPVRSAEKDLMGEKVRELVETPRSQPVKFYLKHKINKELIEGLVGNQKFNDSLLAMQSSKMECEAYHSLHIEPMRKAMLKKMITKREDMGANFVIPCNIGGLKYMDALVDQGSDVNVMPLSIYNRLTNEKLVETDIRLSLARKDIKVKKSKNEQKPTRNEETSTRERFEANIESRIKTVVEKSQESKEKDKGNLK